MSFSYTGPQCSISHWKHIQALKTNSNSINHRPLDWIGYIYVLQNAQIKSRFR